VDWSKCELLRQGKDGFDCRTSDRTSDGTASEEYMIHNGTGKTHSGVSNAASDSELENSGTNRLSKKRATHT